MKMYTGDILMEFLNKTIWMIEECQEKLRYCLKHNEVIGGDRDEYLCRLRHLKYLLLSLNTLISDIFLEEENR